MSSYVASASVARGGFAPSVVSVGESIDRNQVYNSAHPLYVEYSNRLRENIAAIVARESEKQAKAQQAVCTVALDVELKDEISREYPEFRIVWPQMRAPVHAAWAARRQLVNQYMTHHLQRYATSFAHYGGSSIAYMTMGEQAVSLLVDTTSAVAVHESYEDDVAVARYLAGSAAAATEMGWTVPDQLQEAYRSGNSFVKNSSRANTATLQGDALIVDGALHPMSPQQFMSAMFEHSASVGMFSLPYHSSMLVHKKGVLPGVDVHYELDEHDVKFLFPEGVAGATRFSAQTWHQWLVNVTRDLEGLDATSFQFELVGVRGCFMLIRVVRIEASKPLEQDIVHSLQLENGANDFTLVKTWKLKSLASNPFDESSWEKVEVTVVTRVVEKTHDYAMALDPADFSRHAIRKRLAVVNDRVVIQGTSVEIHDALTSEQLDILEIALFTHCFVARYESGKLSQELRDMVDKYARFGSLSFMSRVACIMSTCFSLAYDWTLGAVDEALRRVFDSARRWLGGLPAVKRDSFLPAPEFVRYETIIALRSRPILDAVVELAHGLPAVADLVPGMPGFSTVALLGNYSAKSASAVPLMDTEFEVSRNGSELFCDIVDTSATGSSSDAVGNMVRTIRGLNEFDEDGGSRHWMLSNYYSERVAAVDVAREDYSFDPGYIQTLDDFHDDVVPGVRNVEFKYDPASISVDDQDRSLAADFLSMPLEQGELPKPMNVYVSKLQAYNVTKRPMVFQETLSAMQARNLSAPVLALPQNDDMLIDEILNDFLNIACVPEAREMLSQYAQDPVGLEEKAMADWGGKANPDNVLKVLRYFVENPEAWEELRLGRYEAMIKSDVKPPLSDKPLHSRIEPQLIVHHITAVNAIFSSIFRVLVRRFISLLKPNFMLNLLKDMPEVRDMIQTFHDWNADLKFLENDFSKYDKSQSRFVFALERKLFEMLGMNEKMLEAWGLGHINCDIRSITTGISLSVRFQRKSGDATTAFGNGVLNLMSVVHAYKGTDIVWAVFMGDDSLVAARTVCTPELAVRALAEKFNLQAKFFVTDAPYFASNFVLFNRDERRVVCVPDPVKRVEKWSMAVTAMDPKWQDRYRSAVDSCGVYKQRSNLVGLPVAVYSRYGTTAAIDFEAVGDAMASAIRSEKDFRAMWHEKPEKIYF